MCKFKSLIIERCGNVHYDLLTDKHEDLIEKAGLKDDKNEPDFARVEYVPPDEKYGVFEPLERWELKIDENLRPAWWSDTHIVKCRNAMQEIINKTVLTDGKEHDCKTPAKYFNKNCRIKIYGHSSSENYGHSSSENYDNSSSENHGHSRSVNHDHSRSVNYHYSSSINYGNSSSVNHGNSSSENYGNSSSVNYHNSSSENYGNSSSVNYGNSKIKLKSKTAVYIQSGKLYVMESDSLVVIKENKE